METYADVSDILFRKDLIKTVSTVLLEEPEEMIPISNGKNINNHDQMEIITTVSTDVLKEIEELIPLSNEKNSNALDQMNFTELLNFLSESN